MSDVSVMCRECWTLVDGVEAGNAVRWTLCSDCAPSLAALPSSPPAQDAHE